MSISLVLPLLGQGPHFPAMVREYIEQLDSTGLEYEILLVLNSASKESARDAARATVEQSPKIKIIEGEKSGWGEDVRLGIARSSGHLICFTYCNRTHPGELANVLKAAVKTPGVVAKAVRKSYGRFFYRFFSFLFNLECRALFELPYWDINGTPKVFPREHGALMNLRRGDLLLDLEFCVECHRNGYHMIEVPYPSHPRYPERGGVGILAGSAMYLGAIGMWLRSRRSPDQEPRRDT